MAITLATAGLLSGCAHHEDDKPRQKAEHKWWQSDIDSEDQAFFFGSFFNH